MSIEQWAEHDYSMTLNLNGKFIYFLLQIYFRRLNKEAAAADWIGRPPVSLDEHFIKVCLNNKYMVALNIDTIIQY